MPRLQVLNGKRQGALFEVHPPAEHVVGHRQTATISIDDPWVSWDHARVFFNGDGTCWIEDLGSTNGTYVNCVRVKRERLKHEDIIFLGKTHVIFLAPELAQAGGPAAASGPVGAAFDTGLARASGAHRVNTPLSNVRDPFASTGNTGNTTAAGWMPPAAKKKDPFSDSSVDPFASGPEYAGGLPKLRPASSPGGAPSSQGPAPAPAADAVVARRALQDTHADGEEAAQGGPSLHLSDFQEVAPELLRPSPDEIRQLIGSAGAGGPVEGAAPAGASPRASEMRTRPLDTGAARRALGELAEPGSAPPPSGQGATARLAPGSAPPPYGPGRSPPSGLAPSGLGPASSVAPVEEATHAGAATDQGLLAFERARLEDEVRRLRGALQAAMAKDPLAVRAAAEVLRDQELGRLARRVAELERELVTLRTELTERQRELDRVTEEMIEKEDAIDALRREVDRHKGVAPRSAPAGVDGDLRSLEF